MALSGNILARLDLNLLVAFDAVLAERSTTRAARRLGLTQPAVSHALNRLRHVLGDRLFLWGKGGMRPTPYAEQIAGPIRQALAQIEGAVGPRAFDPRAATRTVTLAIADYIASILVPPLAAHLERAAPRIDLRVRPASGPTALAALDAGEADFAIGGFTDLPDRLRMRTLFADRYVCAMWRGHPLARKRRITLADYCGSAHLLIAPSGEPTGLMDRLLARRGLGRRVAVTVNQFLVAPFVLRDTRLILTLLQRIAARYAAAADLHVVALPLAVPPVRMNLVWHQRMDRDPAHQWIRTAIADLTATL